MPAGAATRLVRDMKRKLVVFGAKQIAEVCAFYFDHDSDYEVVAFTVDGEFLDRGSFAGRPVVSFDELASIHPPGSHDLFVAVSHQKMNRVRADKCAAARAMGYTLARYVSSKAITWPTLSIGENTFVMEGNVVQPFATIGADTILWSGNHIGHHSRIGDHCFLASHIVVSGGVTIGDHCFIGVNATLRDGIRVAERCLVGAGATVMKDTNPDEVYAAAATEPSRVPSSRIRC
jgi:sugar O-acyltransferase (sialic acid O-acetyltransferase NeuD family)